MFQSFQLSNSLVFTRMEKNFHAESSGSYGKASHVCDFSTGKDKRLLPTLHKVCFVWFESIFVRYLGVENCWKKPNICRKYKELNLFVEY